MNDVCNSCNVPMHEQQHTSLCGPCWAAEEHAAFMAEEDLIDAPEEQDCTPCTPAPPHAHMDDDTYRGPCKDCNVSIEINLNATDSDVPLCLECFHKRAWEASWEDGSIADAMDF